MRSWIVDAQNLTDIDVDAKNIEKEILLTPAIRKYLITDRDNTFFVIGPKGYGKTLLLLYKRAMYTTKHGRDSDGTYNILFIPQDGILRTLSKVNFSTEKIKRLSNYDNWRQLWEYCLSLSLINNIYEKNKDRKDRDSFDYRLKIDRLPDQVKDLIKRDSKQFPDYYLNYFLTELDIKSFDKLVEYQNSLVPLLREVHFGAIFFIDNIDIMFQEHLNEDNKILESSMLGITSPAIWYGAQIGLMMATHNLNGLNRHIKVFSTIRSEAITELNRYSSMMGNLYGEELYIEYSYAQLKKIFEMNIQAEQPENLVFPDKKFIDPIYSYIGLKSIKNSWVSNEDENLFDYIYRHSLKNPRELMIYGSKLQEIEPLERTPERIRECINEGATFIADYYINTIKPFSEISDFGRLFDLIYTNILNNQQIVDICKRYNKSTNCKKNKCDTCNKVHVFCNLYKLGLLGVLDKNAGGSLIQKFLHPGERTFDSIKLPLSKFYFMHPILNHKLKDLHTDKQFYISTDMIIGDGRKWDLNYTPISYDIFISYASEEEEIAKSLYESLQKQNVKVWYDKTSLEIGDNIRKTIDIGLSRSKCGAVILSKSFFSKDWPQYELDGLITGKKKIFPIWHSIEFDDVKKYSENLANIFALKTSDGIDSITNSLLIKLKNLNE